MIQPVVENHVQVDFRPVAGQLFSVYAPFLELVLLCQADALEALHGNHAGAAEIRVGLGNGDAGAFLKIARKMAQVAYFSTKIKFS